MGARRPLPLHALSPEVLVGSEGEGLHAGTIAGADLTVRVPMVAGIDSLNVVTACAIALDRLGGTRGGEPA